MKTPIHTAAWAAAQTTVGRIRSRMACRRMVYWRFTRSRWAAARSLIAGLVLAWSGAACAPTGPGDTGTLPPDVQDPTVVKTPIGALGFYHTVVASVAKAAIPSTNEGSLFDLVTYLGILTDELAALPLPTGTFGGYTSLDSRQSSEAAFTNAYTFLHRLRGQAREARGFLTAYLPDSSPALRGHLYALEGYADVLLADVFCSGIPLSTVDFDADYTLAAGSTTLEVYTAAVGLFDSALALTGDSARLQQFAAVGRGRALLALGRYADAAAAIATVPTEFRYEVVNGANTDWSNFGYYFQLGGAVGYGVPSMGDREGQSGLDYRSSGDPRTPVLVPDGVDPFGNRLYFPAKYPTSGPVTFVLADGIEARLIEAEAALHAGGDWLAMLNRLRTDGTYDTQPTADETDDPSAVDTLWHAGSGGVPGLRPLTDPGDHDARVDLIFRERAFWLYLTAHRQGDMRRLIRQYIRSPEQVYPSGTYWGGNNRYGSEITVPVPASEMRSNPNYTGCIHHNA